MRSSFRSFRTCFSIVVAWLAVLPAVQAQFVSSPAPSRRATVASPRAAACHNGQSFGQFLAGLKQRAAAEGVSQRAIAEASPYLTYNQGIVNRDRGQRVFGQ